MSEGKISKVSLLLLINEIIKTNIELLKYEQIEISSCESSSDEYSNTDKDIVETIDNIKKEEENAKKEQEKEKENDEINEKRKKEIEEKEEKEEKKEKKEKSKINGMQYVDTSVNQIEQNIISFKMKEMGINIGRKLVERMLITKNEFNDLRNILKFIGKDVWCVLFNKNADKLQMYKKGIYIIIDNNLEFWLKHLLIDNSTNKKNSFVHYFLILIIGILTGVLKRLNVKCYITYDLNYPQCSFQINITE